MHILQNLYFGGKTSDYDVFKVELTDGNPEAWREVYNLCKVALVLRQAILPLKEKICSA